MKIDPYTHAWNRMASGSPRSEVKNLLEAASADGDIRATYALATWLLSGTKPERVSAFKKLRTLAHSDVKEALFDLGVCYHTGNGTRKNLGLAFKYYMFAALLGDAEACEEVANFFYYGVVVLADKEISRAWQSRANSLRDGSIASCGTPLVPPDY